eukprot:2679858-Rhodomonas_salina.1
MASAVAAATLDPSQAPDSFKLSKVSAILATHPTTWSADDVEVWRQTRSSCSKLFALSGLDGSQLWNLKLRSEEPEDSQCVRRELDRLHH